MPNDWSWRENLRFDGLWWRQFAYLGCVYGPEWWKRYSPAGIAAIIFALVPRARRGAIANTARVLGVSETSWPARRAALRMFADFAHCMTETMEYYGPRPRPIRFEIAEDDPIARSLREGRGAVVVTGHFGNWDIAAKVLRHYDRPVNMVMARETNTTMHQYVDAARQQAGVHIIYSDSSVFSPLNMIRALQRNEVVAMQLDRMMGAGGPRLIPFFGHPAPFPSGPFVLARLARAPLVPVFVPRLGVRHYGIRVGRLFTLPRARDPHALQHVMTEVVQSLERAVRDFPSQWFQFAPFWPADAGRATSPAPSATAAIDEPVRVRRG
jgi:KDO2-lipid IV(A) lauroyltransferase